MPWIIAIMTFLTLLAGAAGLGFAHALLQLRGELAGGYTVQVVEANASSRSAQVTRIAAYLKEQKAIKSVGIVPESRLRAQLEPWIGPDIAGGDLPIPALIDMAVAPGTTVADIEAIRIGVAGIAPAARLEAHQHYLAPVEGLTRTLMWIAAGLVTMMILVTGAVVTLAARSAHEAHRATIDIMHLLGATDRQISRLFQRRLALDAMFGGTVGTVAAGGLLWVIGRSLVAMESELTGMIALPWRSAAILLTIPVFVALVAAVTARITVKRALERNL